MANLLSFTTNPAQDVLDIELADLDCAAVRELSELFGEALEVLLGLLKLLVLFVVCGRREWEAVPDPYD